MGYLGRAAAKAALVSADIPTNSITASHIVADTITAGDLAANSVDSSELVDGSVDLSHMSVNSIDSDQYVDASIDTAHIGNDQIDSQHYADGSIDTAHIADNQITLAKMAGGTDGNIISYDASGDPVAIATGNDGQVLTSAGANNPPAFEDAGGGGITVCDSWRLNTNIGSGTSGTFNSNLQHASTAQMGDGTNAIIGGSTKMTESSGVFTFPTDGVWRIDSGIRCYANGGASAAANLSIFLSVNAASAADFSEVQTGSQEISAHHQYAQITCLAIFDITDTANHKVRFQWSASTAIVVQGTAGSDFTFFKFTRLGDT